MPRLHARTQGYDSRDLVQGILRDKTDNEIDVKEKEIVKLDPAPLDNRKGTGGLASSL